MYFYAVVLSAVLVVSAKSVPSMAQQVLSPGTVDRIDAQKSGSGVESLRLTSQGVDTNDEPLLQPARDPVNATVPHLTDAADEQATSLDDPINITDILTPLEALLPPLPKCTDDGDKLTFDLQLKLTYSRGGLGESGGSSGEGEEEDDDGKSAKDKKKDKKNKKNYGKDKGGKESRVGADILGDKETVLNNVKRSVGEGERGPTAAAHTPPQHSGGPAAGAHAPAEHPGSTTAPAEQSGALKAPVKHSGAGSANPSTGITILPLIAVCVFLLL